MNQLEKCLHLYIGCNTNKGVLVGMRKRILFVETQDTSIEEYDISSVGSTLFLYLKHLSNLNEEQSKRLIKEGFTIGRPYGYTFTNNGFLYLLSLDIDLYGLINAGYAREKMR